MSDNCDYNFVTFDDFGKMAKKYTHNMILMSRYILYISLYIKDSYMVEKGTKNLGNLGVVCCLVCLFVCLFE